MHYGVPPDFRDTKTGRARRLDLVSDCSGEELFLTKLEKALKQGTVDSLVLTLKCGHKVICTFDEILQGENGEY